MPAWPASAGTDQRKMKTMRKNGSRPILMAFAALLVLAFQTLAITAQDNMAQGSMGGQGNMTEVAEKLENMSKQLQLTPQEKQQIRPILMEEAPKMKALKTDTSLGPMQKAMKMRQIADATDAKLQPILTPEQYQKWQQIRAQERQQMMQKMENR
jgi:Spy/CpxP family protein refolding chaperone